MVVLDMYKIYYNIAYIRIHASWTIRLRHVNVNVSWEMFSEHQFHLNTDYLYVACTILHKISLDIYY